MQTSRGLERAERSRPLTWRSIRLVRPLGNGFNPVPGVTPAYKRALSAAPLLPNPVAMTDPFDQATEGLATGGGNEDAACLISKVVHGGAVCSG